MDEVSQRDKESRRQVYCLNNHDVSNQNAFPTETIRSNEDKFVQSEKSRTAGDQKTRLVQSNWKMFSLHSTSKNRRDLCLSFKLFQCSRFTFALQTFEKVVQ